MGPISRGPRLLKRPTGSCRIPAGTIARMFEPLPDVPDHPALELELLDALGARADVRAAPRAERGQRARGASSTGPVTANKTLAVHTAWGRTLKDVFQRYKALRGYDQRYQNGFDCQGLWIEVGVERELGLNSKREIEEYGLDRVRREVPRGRRLVGRGDHARLEAPRPVDGLGQRLLHLQRHEHRVHLAVPEARPRAGLALPRPPLDRVVPALRDVDLRARAAPAATSTGPTRRSSSASRCSTGPASRSSSGRRRRGRCPRTSPPPSIPRRSTAAA